MNASYLLGACKENGANLRVVVLNLES